jgi:hypothetical protein
MQIEALSPVLKSYGLDSSTWSPHTISLVISGISWDLLLEQAFAVDERQGETVSLVERYIRRLEGNRRWLPAYS